MSRTQANDAGWSAWRTHILTNMWCTQANDAGWSAWRTHILTNMRRTQANGTGWSVWQTHILTNMWRTQANDTGWSAEVWTPGMQFFNYIKSIKHNTYITDRQNVHIVMFIKEIMYNLKLISVWIFLKF